ncbi:MAG: Gldg family protein, partial [Bacteroidia bacterium]|nr:Gldg family protein [Bacteroidia bacterium]
MVTGRKSLRAQALVRMLMLAGILVLLNVISSFIFTRFDLTDDKRFTLSENSKKLVGNLKDVVFVRVYLEGDFSPGFTRLQQSTREMLDELRLHAGGNLEYEFIDPSANPDETERNKLYAQLYQKGIQPTTVEERTNEGVKRTYIFPGALVSYANIEMGVQLLKNQVGFPPEQILNNSIQNLEYEICNVIRKVTNPVRPAIAFLEGHGELDTTQVADIANALKASYELKRVRINGRLDALKDFKALVVAKPDSAFDEKDKFVIDQFVMNGGKLIWL